MWSETHFCSVLFSANQGEGSNREYGLFAYYGFTTSIRVFETFNAECVGSLYF